MSPAMFIDLAEDLVAPDDLDEDDLQDLVPLRAVGIDLGTSKWYVLFTPCLCIYWHELCITWLCSALRVYGGSRSSQCEYMTV